MSAPAPEPIPFRPPQKTQVVSWAWRFLLPAYWLTWLQVGLMAFLGALPARVQDPIGRTLGRLFMRLGRSRRRIAATNLRLCFPALDDRELEQLLRRTFESLGISILETATAWFGHPERRLRSVRFEGLDVIWELQGAGHGIVLAGAHFATLDLAGALLAEFLPLDVMYRPDGNALMEYFMQRGRAKRYGAVIARKDTRAAVRRLRDGHTLWYAADQDYGPRHSVFAPFFGIPAATVTATARFARMGRAELVFVSHFRGPGSGEYLFRFERLPCFPSGDDIADATRLNAVIEREIRRDPSQYLWLHRRFKSRPEGEADVY